MDNEKLNNEEAVEEIVEETTEEVAAEEVVKEEIIEEAAESVAEEAVVEETEADEETDEVTVEDAVEEISDEDESEVAEPVEENEVTIVQIWQCPECETVCDEEVCTTCGAQCELVEIEATAGEITEGPRKNIAAIITGAVAAVIILVAVLFGFGVINPYETGYVDVSGVTLEELADQGGMSVSEYKKINGLSWLMPKSTNENAVKNNIKVKTTIAQSGMTFEDFKEYYGWDDKITENSTVGEALGETRLEIILGVKGADEEVAEQTLASFREFYGFGEEVTVDTLYKDIRVAVDKKTRETRIEQEKAAEEVEEEVEGEEADDETVETEDGEASEAEELEETEDEAE